MNLGPQGLCEKVYGDSMSFYTSIVCNTSGLNEK